MDEDKMNGHTAENSAGTAARECPEALKPYRWQKGCASPNPAGRPKRLPFTDCLRAVGDMPLPSKIRAKLENAVGSLPDGMTFAEGLALDEMLAAFGEGVGFRLDVAQDIRRAAEGTETHRIEIVEPQRHGGEELRKHILGKLVEASYKRHKLYNMPMPELEQMAADAGVELEQAMPQLTEGENK